MNVLIIAVDTLRADHLSCYGYPRLTSPHLDRIARQSTVFRDAYSASIPTHPGFTSLLTGHDVFRHQIVTQGGPIELDPGLPTLPELLREAGYRTAAVDNLGRWFKRGFERYEVYRWPRKGTAWRKAEAVNAKLLLVLNELAAQAQPWFLFAHYWDPHTPYLPPAPFARMFYEGDERDPTNRSMDPVFAFEPFADYFRLWLDGVTDRNFVNAQYDAEIAYVDAALAHVFTRLEELDLTADTLVIITADHGEVLDEHPCWYDHHGLYEGNLHVPLILHQPGRIPSGLIVPGFVRLEDLAPTILDYLGLAQRSAALEMRGRSLRPLVELKTSGGTVPALYLTECAWMRKRGWRTADWKLIEALEPDCHGFPPVELYDLREDPGEQRNQADERPEVVAALQREMATYVTSRLAETDLPDPVQTQQITLRKIRTLGTAVPEAQQLQ